MQSRFGHMQINAQPDNLPFYKDLLTNLGWHILYDSAEMFGAADAQGISLWFVGQAKPVSNDYDGPGVNHIALSVSSQGDVDAAAGYLTGRGVELLFETPRHRPEFSGSDDQTYYQIMFETPDRLLLEIVYTGPKDDSASGDQ